MRAPRQQCTCAPAPASGSGFASACRSGRREGRLVGAAAARSGRTPEQVGSLLYGPEPTTDAVLVALGHDLEALMVEVGGA